MPIRHVTHQIEAYLDNQLPPKERRRVREHLGNCPTCTRHLSQAQRVVAELGPTMNAALGQPAPPAALRHRIRQQLIEANTPRRLGFPWLLSGRVLNAVGTLAMIALLAFGAYAVIQGQIPGTGLSTQTDTLGPNIGGGEATSPATPVSSSTSVAQTQPTPVPKASSSIGDTLPRSTPMSGTINGQENLTLTNQEPEVQLPAGSQPENDLPPDQNTATTRTEPEGTIAFSFFNPAPYRQVYEIHLIDADGSNHRLFPLDGVSEPALRQTAGDHRLAYRAWAEPTTPRSLLTSDPDGEFRDQASDFWEDAQPDWSPTENRLIFASQRESDRRWRLYTSWGDGSTEKELRREGKSPSFAPNGHDFVFEGCDNTDNRCGLWLGNLADSEYGSVPLLENPLARSPDWSPTNEQIVYMANPKDNWDLYLIKSDGTGVPRRLTTDSAIDGLPTWSPDASSGWPFSPTGGEIGGFGYST